MTCEIGEEGGRCSGAVRVRRRVSVSDGAGLLAIVTSTLCDRHAGRPPRRTMGSHYRCACGATFPLDLGRYGCPNCEGAGAVEHVEVLELLPGDPGVRRVRELR